MGLIGLTDGGTLVRSLIAIMVGTVIGTFFMALYSAQGPQLGLPHRSRPEFGYVGALMVWLFACVQHDELRPCTPRCTEA
ncbi:cytosine permease [Streptomyces sp. NPDC005262]|uniref:cytosine permease n=1 Tax=Streptomyces sp. NPDC005262 TaxID=3364710 RepID=UPI0036C835BB